MSKLQKRVELARDVKAMLKAQKYYAESGTYVGISKGGPRHTTMETLIQPEVSCNVCAIGSLFVSHIRKTKQTGNIDLHCSTRMTESMEDIFTERELRLLEMCFENADISDEFSHEEKLQNDATDFYEESGGDYEDTKRLNAIMDNIIKNKGHFKYKSIKI